MHRDGGSDSAGWAEPFRGERYDRGPGDDSHARLIPVPVLGRLCPHFMHAVSAPNVVVAEFGSETNLRITTKVMGRIRPTICLQCDLMVLCWRRGCWF